MSKIIFALVILCVVQYINANALPHDDKKKLQEAKKDLLNEIKSMGRKISSSKKDVEDMTDDIEHDIKHELKELKKVVKQAEKAAEKSDKSIKSCVKAEKNNAKTLEKDLDHLEDCEETRETKEAGRKLDEIRDLIGVLETAYEKCNIAENTSKCVDDTIKDVWDKTKHIEAEIEELLKNVDPNEQDKCVAEKESSLNKKLAKINKDWNKCVAKA